MKASKKVLMELCWERVEYSTLLQQCQAMKAYFEGFVPFLNPTNPRVVEVTRQSLSKKPDFLKYLKNLFVKRQPGAMHVMGFWSQRKEMSSCTVYLCTMLRTIH